MQLNHSDVLKNARKSRHGYDTNSTRALLTAAVKSAFSGNEPHKFQLDVVEALILGLDVTAIAGTGSGKTLPWVMPLLLEENKAKIILVISPLKALQADHVRPYPWMMTASLDPPQATFFNRLGVRATPINGDSWQKEKLRQVSEVQLTPDEYLPDMVTGCAIGKVPDTACLARNVLRKCKILKTTTRPQLVQIHYVCRHR
jgi:hypothetical protein